MYYQVAGHKFIVETPNAEQTAKLLPNFDAFRLPEQEKAHAVFASRNDILFNLSGNALLTLPTTPADDSFEWNETFYEVYKTPHGWLIAMQLNNQKHWLEASHNWRILKTDLSLTDQDKRLFLNNFLIVAFGMASAPLGTLKVHASVIEKDGQALLFLGKSGTGKSTHSRLWSEFVQGCSLLNDDEPVVRIAGDGTVTVYGTPWSGKTPCYRNASARVTAFVHLYQHPENKIRKMTGVEAFASLFSSSCIMRNDEDNKNHIFNTVADILKTVPAYRLDCRPDREAVSLTEALME